MSGLPGPDERVVIGGTTMTPRTYTKVFFGIIGFLFWGLVMFALLGTALVYPYMLLFALLWLIIGYMGYRRLRYGKKQPTKQSNLVVSDPVVVRKSHCWYCGAEQPTKDGKFCYACGVNLTGEKQ
jgi:hypothetical protein